MQITNHVTNRQTLDPFVKNSTGNSTRAASSHLTLTDILSHPLQAPKSKLRSGIRANLALKLKKKNPLKSPKARSQLTTPKFPTDKEVPKLDPGMQIRRLHATIKCETIKYKKPIIKETKNEKVSGIISQYSPFNENFLIIQKSQFNFYNIRLNKKFESHPGFNGKSDVPKDFVVARKTPSKLEKISFKEAMRDKEWMSKAKSQIMKSVYLCINKSNGLEAVPGADSYCTYKYYLGKGNNSSLIKQCLSTRWWWTRVTEDEIGSANLIWTQWVDRSALDSFPRLSLSHQIESRAGVALHSNTKYYDSESKPFAVDISGLGYNLITLSKHFVSIKPVPYNTSEIKMHNKIEHNFHLANKKALFFNLKHYYNAVGCDIFNVIPVTYHLIDAEDPTFYEFEAYFKQLERSSIENSKKIANLWILKPGENSNRGNGIVVCSSIDQIKSEIKSNFVSKTNKHTYIVQKYIENPFLVYKRKFDIRCYALVTCFNGVLQGYFFTEGYLRTASKHFSLLVTNKFVHLTNDAVQKHSEDYGKYENGNKMSYNDFQRYIDTHLSEKKVNFVEEILPRIKNIVTDTLKAVYLKLDPNKRAHTFEIFGYDFLLDSDLKPWLLEANTNPCLELSSPHLVRIIPNLIENALKICIDPIFQEPSNSRHSNSGEMLENKFELIFHSCTMDQNLIEKLKKNDNFQDNENFMRENQFSEIYND
jgi:tubulin---tyrosine ligase